MMELILASANMHKKQELSDILEKSGFDTKTINPAESIDVLETADSFEGNATLKALTYAKRLGKPCLADDSGLCVDALNQMPGIYSARYSGLGDQGNNDKLLDEMKNNTNRTAYFVCVIAIAFPDEKIFLFKGVWHGTISYQKEGIGGFGYDSVFIPEGEIQTVASLTNAFKSKYSHRARALEKLMEGKDEIINYWRYTWQK